MYGELLNGFKYMDHESIKKYYLLRCLFSLKSYGIVT